MGKHFRYISDTAFFTALETDLWQLNITGAPPEMHRISLCDSRSGSSPSLLVVYVHTYSSPAGAAKRPEVKYLSPMFMFAIIIISAILFRNREFDHRLLILCPYERST